jgi:hypothetical protein
MALDLLVLRVEMVSDWDSSVLEHEVEGIVEVLVLP